MQSSLDHQLQAELATLAAQNRTRSCPTSGGSSRTAPTLDSNPVLSFCSNDYLGLSNHPALAEAAGAAIARSGMGAGASRLVAGDLPEHRELEAALAAFLDTEAVLLFPSGYQTNLGVITALAAPGDLILSDHSNHASIIDACRLSRARPAFYKHLDLASAEERLHTLAPAARRKFIVTESLFGMDGDAAPIPELAALARKHGAALLVDEAHALGVQGPGGRGLCHQAGVTPDVLVGTLSKAFASSGGFVAGSATLRTYLVNRSRTFIFTTAPPPATAAAALAALHIIRGEEGQRRRDALTRLVLQLASHLPPSVHRNIHSPIFPIILGPDHAALSASRALRASGLFVQAIRPPTVPEGSARLRITLSANHHTHDVDALAHALTPILPR